MYWYFDSLTILLVQLKGLELHLKMDLNEHSVIQKVKD